MESGAGSYQLSVEGLNWKRRSKGQSAKAGITEQICGTARLCRAVSSKRRAKCKGQRAEIRWSR